MGSPEGELNPPPDSLYPPRPPGEGEPREPDSPGGSRGLPNPLKRPRWILGVDWLEKVNGREQLRQGVVLGSGFAPNADGSAAVMMLKIYEPATAQVVYVIPDKCRVVAAFTEDAPPHAP